MAEVAVHPANTPTRPRGRQKGETYERGPRRRIAGAELIQLVPAKQAEVETGIPYTTLRKMHHLGQIAVVKFGAAWFFRRDEINALIERNTERATA